MTGLNFEWLKKGARSEQTPPLLRVSDLKVRVGIRRVLYGVELEIFEGDHVHVTGLNGSGKSTLLNAIAGVEPAKVFGGEITFQGKDITRTPSHERAMSGITYMRQTDNVFPSLSVGDNLQLALGPHGTEKFYETFPRWHAELPLEISAGALSGGQRKKIAWAMNVLRMSALFLVDEPYAGVSERFELPEKTTCLLVSHQ